MAIVRKYLTNHDYTKADNKIAQNKNIKDAAKVLYWYMASHKNAFQLNDAFTRKVLGWSQAKISRAKDELKSAGLIHVEKIDRSTYFLYIGSSELSALEVKENWDELENIGDKEFKPKKKVVVKKKEVKLEESDDGTTGENAFQ